ncbi:MAG: NAD(P)-dependent oxidoreductase [Terracidiphilus sp.]|jgi:3-hydroxyisobutyrate dehydrogenase-like beta-hydroxyacid dehydrogenase
MKIAFLGLGKMGLPMARRLLEAGHELTVWNRSPERAEALVAAGATLAGSPAEAAQTANAVLTSLFDDAANEEVLFGTRGDSSAGGTSTDRASAGGASAGRASAGGPSTGGSSAGLRAAGVVDALRPGALHISLSTISVALSERLTAEHARRGQPFVAAPVFGRPDVAEEGRLWIVAAGEESAIAAARPLLEPLARGISVIGAEPRQAHALKLGGNFLISAMIHSLGESFVYAAAQGIDPEVFLETVNSALFQSPFYAAYGKVMLHPPLQPGATMALGEKDLRLLREAAAGRNTRLSLADNLAEVFAQARQAGLGGEDWAVGQYRMAQRRGGIE